MDMYTSLSMPAPNMDTIYDIIKDGGYKEVKSRAGCYGCVLWQGHANPIIMPFDRKVCRFIAMHGCETRRTILAVDESKGKMKGMSKLDDIILKTVMCIKNMGECHV